MTTPMVAPGLPQDFVPDADAPGAPAPTPGLPQGFVPDPPAPGAAVPPWQGSVLPVSTDTAGKLHFDPTAGILGKAIDAFTLPSDVYSGRQQTPYGTGVDDPGLMQRAVNFATFATPAQQAPIATAARIPTTLELKTAADAGYAAARAADMTIPAGTVADMATSLQSTLQTQYGAIPKVAPKTNALLDELANPPRSGNPQANYTGLEAARRGLQAIAGEGGSDGFAAQQAIPHLDTFIDAISPDAAAARANYAAAQRSNDITGDLTRANTGMQEQAEMSAAASNSGKNLDNSLRQRVKSFLQNPDNVRGYSDDEIAALNSFVSGGFSQNVLRTLSNLMGGGGGLGRLISGGVGAYLGSKMSGGSEAATAIGSVALPTLGAALKSGENSLASRGLDAIAQMLRSRSPLGQQMQQQGGPGFAPGWYNPGAPQLMLPGGGSTVSPQVPMGPRGQLPPLPTTGPIPQGLLGPWA